MCVRRRSRISLSQPAGRNLTSPPPCPPASRRPKTVVGKQLASLPPSAPGSRGPLGKVAYSLPAKSAFEASNIASGTATSQHRRRSSRGAHVPPEGLVNGHGSKSIGGPTRTTFDTIPYEDDESAVRREYNGRGLDMSLDHSPSPSRGGGWSSPGLTTPFEDTNGGARSRSPAVKHYGDLHSGQSSGGSGVTWASAKERSARVNGYPRYQSQNEGFFTRHYRNISEGLPYFAHGGQEDRYAEKEKLGRGRIGGNGFNVAELPRRVGLLMSRRRKYVALVLLMVVGLCIWFNDGKSHAAAH